MLLARTLTALPSTLAAARSDDMVADKYQEQWLEREFVGYGFNQPDPQWPGGAKIAVSFVMQFNMGAVGAGVPHKEWRRSQG
jgi:hypothetical protein